MVWTAAGRHNGAMMIRIAPTLASALLFVVSGCASNAGSPTALPLTSSVQDAAQAPTARVQSPSVIPNGSALTSPSRSWMDPAAEAKSLVYVSTSGLMTESAVEVYTWAGAAVGRLTGFVSPAYLCADKHGNVSIPDYSKSQIFEYAHGGTSPIAVLNDLDHSPSACFSDDVTGDLAVVDHNVRGGGIAIYQKTSGNPRREYIDNFKTYAFCGYDVAGDLFVDGKDGSEHFILAELPKGSRSWIRIRTDISPGKPTSVQWDGKYLAIGDATYNTADQYEISGSTGTLIGHTSLGGGQGPVRSFWIPKFGANNVDPQAKHIVAAQHLDSRIDWGDVGFWDYPKGGHATHLIEGPDHPLGVTVSVLPAK